MEAHSSRMRSNKQSKITLSPYVLVVTQGTTNQIRTGVDSVHFPPSKLLERQAFESRLSTIASTAGISRERWKLGQSV